MNAGGVGLISHIDLSITMVSVTMTFLSLAQLGGKGDRVDNTAWNNHDDWTSVKYQQSFLNKRHNRGQKC